MPQLTKREYYARPEVAATYFDFSFGGASGRWVEERETQAVLDFVGSARSVLDLACGEGRVARRLRGRPRVVGCDASLPMLAIAQQRRIEALAAADAFTLPFAAGSFESVVCARLFIHYPDFEAILTEIARVLAPGGGVVFDTFRWSPRAGLPLLTGGWDGRIYTNSVSDVQRRLALAGWEVKARRGCFLFSPLAYRYLPLPIVQLLGLIERATPDALLVKDYWKVCRRGPGRG